MSETPRERRPYDGTERGEVLSFWARDETAIFIAHKVSA
jgi:hypothetical protein